MMLATCENSIPGLRDIGVSTIFEIVYLWILSCIKTNVCFMFSNFSEESTKKLNIWSQTLILKFGKVVHIHF